MDENPQIQALDRTLPTLPVGPSYSESYKHDYFRQGTTTLFTVLDVASGKVIAQGKPRHQEFLAFLRLIDKETPADLAAHLVLDNDATHKHSKVQAWLDRRRCYHPYFTPTYLSRPNQVGRWFGLTSQRAINRGSFRDFADPVNTIKAFTEGHNARTNPFIWAAMVQPIIG